MKLTPHFTFEELTNTNVSKEMLEKNKRYAAIIPDQIFILALFAEQVRFVLDVPMTITSGFRCEALNKAIGGSDNSQHMLAQAIDFLPGKGMSIDKAFDILKNSCLLYGQLIKERSGKSEWIHISMGYKRENLKYIDGKYKKV